MYEARNLGGARRSRDISVWWMLMSRRLRELRMFRAKYRVRLPAVGKRDAGHYLAGAHAPPLAATHRHRPPTTRATNPRHRLANRAG